MKTQREKDLIKAMHQHGYMCCSVDGREWFLCQVPSRRYSPVTIPYRFKSIQAAADHLAPIIRSQSFTALVIGDL